MLAYYKKTGDNHILCVVNLDPHNTQGGHVQMPLHELGVFPGDRILRYLIY